VTNRLLVTDIAVKEYYETSFYNGFLGQDIPTGCILEVYRLKRPL
jgi:hypothetical protein